MNALCKLSLRTKTLQAENENPKERPPNFKIFNHSRQTHEIFKVGKYAKKINFDEIWGYQNEGSPSNGATKNLNFQTVAAGWIKYSEWVHIKNQLNLTKIGDSKMGVPLKQGRKNSNFLTTYARLMKYSK